MYVAVTVTWMGNLSIVQHRSKSGFDSSINAGRKKPRVVMFDSTDFQLSVSDIWFRGGEKPPRVVVLYPKNIQIIAIVIIFKLCVVGPLSSMSYL